MVTNVAGEINVARKHLSAREKDLEKVIVYFSEI